MRVVLDTNIWLSAIFWEGEAHKLIKKLKRKDAEIFISEYILSEIIDVLNKEAKFQKFIKDMKIATEDLLRTILYMARLIKPKTRLRIIKEHSPDNRILECAVDGKVNYLISYDNHLLKLRKYKNIEILTPTEFNKR